MTPPTGPVAFVARALAYLGGAALLAAGAITTASVLLRWATDQPVRGDFEMVSIATAIAVFGFLAFGTLMRANILVDSFTARLPTRLAGLLDAFWMLVWAALAFWLAERMLHGAWDLLRSNTRTIGLLALPYWWAVGLGAICFAATGAAALWLAARRARGG